MADRPRSSERPANPSSGGLGPSQGPAADGARPLSYDFRRPQRVGKEQGRLLESLHEQFARSLAGTLAGALRGVVDVDLAYTDQTLYGEFAQTLDRPCTAYSFGMEPPGNRAVLALATDLVMAVIDRSFGGRGLATGTKARPLTPIEATVANQLAQRILDDLETTWAATSPMQVKDPALESNPDLIQATGQGDPVLVVAFEVNAPHVTGLVHLCYPMRTVEPLIGRLTERHRQGGAAAPRQLESRARDMAKLKVPVVVQLATGTLALGDLARLKPGDVVKLDTPHEEPAVVFLGKQPKYLGRPGLDGRYRAVKIVRLVSPEEEELFR